MSHYEINIIGLMVHHHHHHHDHLLHNNKTTQKWKMKDATGTSQKVE